MTKKEKKPTTNKKNGNKFEFSENLSLFVRLLCCGVLDGESSVVLMQENMTWDLFVFARQICFIFYFGKLLDTNVQLFISFYLFTCLSLLIQ